MSAHGLLVALLMACQVAALQARNAGASFARGTPVHFKFKSSENIFPGGWFLIRPMSILAEQAQLESCKPKVRISGGFVVVFMELKI